MLKKNKNAVLILSFMIVLFSALYFITKPEVLLDPYQVLGIVKFKKINFSPNQRYVKLEYMMKKGADYDAILFGSSRSNAYKVDTLNRIFGRKFYSYNVGKDSINEQLSRLAFILNVCSIKFVIICLDTPYYFNAEPIDKSNDYYFSKIDNLEYKSYFVLRRTLIDFFKKLINYNENYGIKRNIYGIWYDLRYPYDLQVEEHPFITNRNLFDFYASYLSISYNTLLYFASSQYENKFLDHDLITGNYILEQRQAFGSFKKTVSNCSFFAGFKENIFNKDPGIITPFGSQWKPTFEAINHLSLMRDFLERKKMKYLVIINPLSAVDNSYSYDQYSELLCRQLTASNGFLFAGGINEIYLNEKYWKDSIHFSFDAGNYILTNYLFGTEDDMNKYYSKNEIHLLRKNVLDNFDHHKRNCKSNIN